MPTVTIQIPCEVPLALAMARVRELLDAWKCIAESFEWALNSQGLTMSLGFSEARDAERFERRFVGHERDLMDAKPKGPWK